MGRTRRLLALTTLGAVALPPLAAAVARARYRITGDDEDDLRVAAIFSGRDALITSTGLRGGQAIAWYGGLDLDLRRASLDPAGAHLRVLAIFGGARVIVPTGWSVRVRPFAVFGGVDVRTEAPLGPAPELTIDAVATFGGVEVTDRPVEDEPDVVLRGPGLDAEFARAEAEAQLEAVAGAAEAEPVQAEHVAEAEPVQAEAQHVAEDELAHADQAEEGAAEAGTGTDPQENVEGAGS